jgi:7-cyano-7-deazaguanine synthase
VKKTVIILSGGMDSTTMVYFLKNKGHELHAISFDYGQRHSRELIKAMVTCTKLGITHELVDLQSLTHLISNSSLTSDTPVPEGHYADENMKSTVVPNRNMIMLSIAAGYAINIGATAVAYGAHAGDHAIYPDCRPTFGVAMANAFNLCDFNELELLTPFMDITKNDICEIGKTLGVPFEDTWTCYKGLDVPCGVCGACVERTEAFEYVGIVDPLVGGASC